VLNRLFTGLALTLLFTLGACEKSQKAEGAKENPPTEATSTADPAPSTAAQVETQPEPAKAATQSGEIVFNPLKPPAGYTKCHHNHCHVVGGGVESYQQVMQKMGATKIIEAPKPPAPADVAAPPADAKRTASGLAYKLLTAGSSDKKPTLKSTVVAHLNSWSTDGKSLSSTAARKRPATIPLARVYKGLQEAFMLMEVGSEYRFWIPGNLVRRPDQGTIVFDVQLIGSSQPPATP